MDDPSKTADESRRFQWEGREYTPVVERIHDTNSGDELTSSIVLALADATAVDPHELVDPVLYDSVDLEAVQRVLRDAQDSAEAVGTNEVRFEYDGLLVTVQSDGHIEVAEPTAE